MASVFCLFKTRFERMKVKEQPIMCYHPADEQDIPRFFDISRQIYPAINQETLMVSQLNEIDGYKDFFEKHCFLTTYMFQVKKNAKMRIVLFALFYGHRVYQPKRCKNSIFCQHRCWTKRKNIFKSFPKCMERRQQKRTNPV